MPARLVLLDFIALAVDCIVFRFVVQLLTGGLLTCVLNRCERIWNIYFVLRRPCAVDMMLNCTRKYARVSIQSLQYNVF